MKHLTLILTLALPLAPAFASEPHCSDFLSMRSLPSMMDYIRGHYAMLNAYSSVHVNFLWTWQMNDYTRRLCSADPDQPLNNVLDSGYQLKAQGLLTP